MKYTAIYDYKVVCLIPHLPPVVAHAPRPPISLPVLAAWEEVRGQFLQSLRHNIRCDVLSAKATTWRYQFGVKITGDHQRRFVEALADDSNGALDHCNFVGGNISADNKLESPIRRQLEVCHIRHVRLDGLELKMGRVSE